MKIVLLENVKKLGKKDEVVEVSDGYARNVIIPKKLGIEATTANLNNLMLKNKNEAKKEEHLRAKANENKNFLEKKTFTLTIKAGANGKTFGSITSKEIADVIMKETEIDIDKKDILIDDGLKNLGTYDVKIKLHKDIVATVKVDVMEG